MKLTVYEKPTCTKCRQLHRLLVERGIDHDRIDLHAEGLSEPQLRDLLAKLGVGPHEVLRTREPAAKAARALDAEALIAAMVADPTLVERPIVVRGDRAIVARPTERVLELLSG